MIYGDIVESVRTELRNAEQHHPEWPRDMIYAGAIVGEEAGELLQAINNLREGKGGRKAVLEEAVQTAAMAVRFLQHFEEME